MSNKTTLIASLNDGVNQFNELISSLDQAAFETNYNNKSWFYKGECNS